MLLEHSPTAPHPVSAHELHEPGEALVEPQVVPPLGRDQIAEPHVRNLVYYDRHMAGQVQFIECVLSGTGSCVDHLVHAVDLFADALVVG